MRELLLDANVLVRFLIGDGAKHRRVALALFREVEEGKLVLHLDPLIMAEVVYVLQGPYRQNRAAISNALAEIIQSPGIITENSRLVIDALERYATKNVDFADAWLAARTAESGLFISSFDKDLDKLPDLTREEPKA